MKDMNCTPRGGPAADVTVAILEAKTVIGSLLTPGERFPSCAQLKSAWAALQRVDLASIGAVNTYGR